MHTLLDENFWNFMLFEETWDWQATMMQQWVAWTRFQRIREGRWVDRHYDSAVTRFGNN